MFLKHVLKIFSAYCFYCMSALPVYHFLIFKQCAWFLIANSQSFHTMYMYINIFKTECNLKFLVPNLELFGLHMLYYCFCFAT